MSNFVGDLNLEKYEDYINVFDALSHPARIKIIGILAEGWQYERHGELDIWKKWHYRK